MMRENEVASVVVDTAFHVHTELGPGLFESVYEAVMAYELRKRGLQIETQRLVPVMWGGMQIEIGFRIDILVEQCLVVELKSVEKLQPVHKKQLLTYLRLANCRLGLLINFNTERIKDGITRVVNNLPETPGNTRQSKTSSG